MSLLLKFKKVLVAEDDPALRKALVAKIESEGFQVIETGEGSEVIGLIQTKEPNLVVLDLMLPGRDGVSILETMRDEAWENDTPVIVLTNLSGRGGLENEVTKLNAQYFDKASTDLNTIVEEIKKRI